MILIPHAQPNRRTAGMLFSKWGYSGRLLADDDLEGDEDALEAGLGVGALLDVLEVLVDGARLDAELVGNLVRLVAGRQQGKDFALARREERAHVQHQRPRSACLAM